MGNWKSGRFVLVLVALALVMGFVGCIDNDKSLVIMHNVAPDDSCVYEEDTGSFWSRGFLDLNHPVYGSPAIPTYYFFPEVHNYMPTNLSIPNNELDAMAIQLSSATISYEWLEGRDSLAFLGHGNLEALETGEEVIFLSGILCPADTSGKPGMMVLTHLRLIPPEVGTQLAGLGSDAGNFVLGVHIVISGTTLGGVDIDSNEFIYPIEFCWGCLSYTCPDGITYPPSCQPGQDSNLDCPDENP